MEEGYLLESLAGHPVIFIQVGSGGFGHRSGVDVEFAEDQVVDFRLLEGSRSDQNSKSEHSGNDDLVFFEKTSSGEGEGGHGDRVDNIIDSLLEGSG